MLSGIGDLTHLSSLGIQPLVHLPYIGQNLQDHPLLTNQFIVSSNITLDNLSQNATFAAEQMVLWETNRTGELGLGANNLWGWLRVPQGKASEDVFRGFGDPSAGARSGHFELIFTVCVLPAVSDSS